MPSEPGAEGEARGDTPAGHPAGAAGPAAPLWQLAAPKADLYISKEDAATGEAGKEPYPKKFEEIIEFLQSGKEIPGIQKIPDTVISDPVSSKHTHTLSLFQCKPLAVMARGVWQLTDPVDFHNFRPASAPQAVGEARRRSRTRPCRVNSPAVIFTALFAVPHFYLKLEYLL